MATTDKLTIKGYLEHSRSMLTSLVLVVPLFILYQIGVLMTGGIRNGVDFVTSILWSVSNGSLAIYLGINALILVGFFVAIFFLKKRGELNLKVWPFVLVESTLYAMCFGSVILFMTSSLGLTPSLSTGPKEFGVFSNLVLSIGAGLYEEIVFRLVLMGGLFWAFMKVKGFPTIAAAIIAVVVSSLIFSAIHYVGSLGDPFTISSFSFRFFAGIVLAAIFYVRGFAVAVYTHAIYDIIVTVFN